MQTAESIQLKRKKVEKQDVFYCWVIKARKCTSWIWDPFGRDCVAYTIPIKSPYGSKLPTVFFSGLCTYLSNAKFLVPMRLGDTPVPIPNTTVKTQSADGTALETVWESRWAPDQKKTTGWKPDDNKTGIGKWVLSETGWSQIRIVKSGANPYQPGRAVKICWFYQWLEILNKKSIGRNIWCF